MAQILGKYWRSRGTSSRKFVWSSISQIVMGKTIRGSAIGTWLEMSVCSSKTRSILIGVRKRQKKSGKSRTWLPCGRNWWKMWILMNPPHFLTMYFWDVLNVNANQTKLSLNSVQRCLNHVFLLEQLKCYQCGKNFTQKQWRGPSTLKDMLENASRDTVNWQTKKWNSFTKFQVFGWMIINSNRKDFNQSENYHKCAHRLW